MNATPRLRYLPRSNFCVLLKIYYIKHGDFKYNFVLGNCFTELKKTKHSKQALRIKVIRLVRLI